MSLSLGRVHRSADSHVRVTPLASLYVFLSAVRIDPPCRTRRGSLVGPDLLDQFCPHRLALELYVKGWFFIVQDVMGEAGLASRSHLRGAQCRGPWLRLQTWLRVYCSRGYNNLDGVSHLCSNILKIAKGCPALARLVDTGGWGRPAGPHGSRSGARPASSSNRRLGPPAHLHFPLSMSWLTLAAVLSRVKPPTNIESH
jgi:hypothetical protein